MSVSTRDLAPMDSATVLDRDSVLSQSTLAMEAVQAAKQRYAKELAAYTINQWSVAKQRAESGEKPSTPRRSSQHNAALVQRRTHHTEASSDSTPDEDQAPSPGPAPPVRPDDFALDRSPVSSERPLPTPDGVEVS